MTDATATPASPPIPRRAVVAVVIGNWFEFYDFIVYTFFSVMIAEAFFPGESDFDKLLAALAAFGVGFFTRPLGAAVIGAYADRAGRKAALTVTLLLMAVGTGMVALTPTYESIGIAAPIMLVFARLIQGFSCGGEVGPATSYLMEAAPANRRAAVTSWQGQSQQLASIMGSGIGVILAFTLSKEDLYDWGWRIPFLLGILIAPLGLYIRQQLPETIDKSEAHASGRAVLWHLMTHHSRAVLLGVLIICGGTISTYVFNYMTTYAIRTLHLSEQVATSLSFTGSAISMVGIWIGAYIADRYGRKPILVISRIVFVASVYPAYLVLTAPGATAVTVISINVLLNFLFSIGIGGTYAFLTEAFPKSVRSSGLSILYALSVTIFGGTTQFAVAWLIETLQDPLVPAWYQIAANIVSIVAIMLMVPDKEAVPDRRTGGAAPVAEVV